MKSTPALRFTVAPSRLALAGLALLHLMALAMPWFAQLGMAVRFALLAVVCLSAFIEWHRWGRGLPLDLRLLPDGKWGVGASPFDEIEAALLPGVFRSNHLIVLPLAFADGSKRRIVLWPDSAPADELRRLRAWLRWGAEFGVSDDAGEAEESS